MLGGNQLVGLRRLAAGLVLVASLHGADGAVAQTPPAPSNLPVTRAIASRAEIEASLAEIDQILASPGFSGRIKEIKRREADLMRRRLAEGDFFTGDKVFVSIVGEPLVNDSFVVTPSRTILIPGVAEFPLNGVLRSELQPHMTQQLGRFFRSPVVITKAFIRLSILGGIGAPGYYHLAADQLLGSAIMSAGGPNGGTKMEKSKVLRNGQEIRSSDAVQDALTRGLTLDQFNLQAGDELVVGTRGTGLLANARNIGFAIGAVSSLIFLGARIIP